jgi:hypothetical protein
MPLRKAASTMTTETAVQVRLEQVERHVALENRHDLDGVMDTFGVDGAYDHEPWDEHPRGRDEHRTQNIARSCRRSAACSWPRSTTSNHALS